MFLSGKINFSETFKVCKDGYFFDFTIGQIVKICKTTSPKQQKIIKDSLIKRDFFNESIRDYFIMLGQSFVNKNY